MSSQSHTYIAAEEILRPLRTMLGLVKKGVLRVDHARSIYEALEPQVEVMQIWNADFEVVHRNWAKAWADFEEYYAAEEAGKGETS
jgi:hypothetical protein